MSSSCPMLPRIVVAAIYKYLGESMKLLWSKGLEMNLVHITDVCRAAWLLTTSGNSGDVYNLADKGCTTQGALCEVILLILVYSTVQRELCATFNTFFRDKIYI